ncbi:MAG: RNA polymerase sigma-70 factor [Thermoflavifilum sp.]|nr:RNA polymerase sigma-70 factor [Thermoflavifilum sp.]
MKQDVLLTLRDRIAHDDERAFEELMEVLMSDMHAYAWRLLNDQLLAEEVVMDVFVKLWQQRHGFAEVQNPLYYLLRAVKNTALNYLRQRAKMPVYSDHGADYSLQVCVTPEDVLISKEQLHQIQEALDALPPRAREVLLLCKEYRLSYAEVAELLGISTATVNVHMTQALKKLWQSLQALHLISS